MVAANTTMWCLYLFVLELHDLEQERDSIVINNEIQSMVYYRIRQQLEKLKKELHSFITRPKFCLPFLQPGRLVKVVDGDCDFGWGCVVNFLKKPLKKVFFVESSSWVDIDYILKLSNWEVTEELWIDVWFVSCCREGAVSTLLRYCCMWSVSTIRWLGKFPNQHPPETKEKCRSCFVCNYL